MTRHAALRHMATVLGLSWSTRSLLGKSSPESGIKTSRPEGRPEQYCCLSFGPSRGTAGKLEVEVVYESGWLAMSCGDLVLWGFPLCGVRWVGTCRSCLQMHRAVRSPSWDEARMLNLHDSSGVPRGRLEAIRLGKSTLPITFIISSCVFLTLLTACPPGT